MGTAPGAFSKDFSIDTSVLAPGSATKITVTGSADSNALKSIITNDQFPSGTIELGQLAVQGDTGDIKLQAAGTALTLHATAHFKTGVGVYDAASDAMAALQLDAPPQLDLSIGGPQNSRYLLMMLGYDIAGSFSGSHPVGVLGSVSFGIDAKRDGAYAVLHRFDATAPAHTVVADTVASLRLPRQVAFDEGRGQVNLAPGTWVLAEADGSIAIKIGAQLGYDVSFTREAKLLGITRNLGAKIDASLKATFGFSASGKYIVCVGRELSDPASQVLRLRLFKQSQNGLDFGLNLAVGVSAEPALPDKFDDFVEAVFGVYGQQVVNDLHVLEQWTDPTKDLGDTVARLANKTGLELLQKATGLNLPDEFNKARDIVVNALKQWSALPGNLSGMLWKFLESKPTGDTTTNFMSFLTALADPNAATRSQALAKAIETATFGDTPQGQFLESIAEHGLLALSSNLDGVSKLAQSALDVLNGGIIAKLQSFIGEKLDLDTIRSAVTDADFNQVDEWLIKRLADFLDKEIALTDLKEIQKAIFSVDQKVRDIYSHGIAALGNRFSIEFAETYQKTVTGAALLDVNFNLANAAARTLFAEVVANSNLDALLVTDTAGVTLNSATLSHEIKRTGTVGLHMPFFSFDSTHVNDSLAKLTAEEQAGRLLLYEVDANDSVTVKNRSTSQLSVLGSLQVRAGESPQLSSGGTIAYDALQIKTNMRPLDLQQRTQPFINSYLSSLFPDGGASIVSFYAGLDHAIAAAINNQSSLGDIALSMQVEMPAAVLEGWFVQRNAQQLTADSMRLSRQLQASLKRILPAFYFQNLENLQFNTAAAALLVWSALPVSTSIAFDGDSITQFNTDKDPFWDFADVNLRRAVARDPHTLTSLASMLALAQARLREAGQDAGFFDPSMAGRFVEAALNTSDLTFGDILFSGLLFTEAQMVHGAVSALQNIAAFVKEAGSSPTRAIEQLAQYAADLTDTFNSRLSSTYGNDSLRTLGPMVLTEASAAVSPASGAATPRAMLKLYSLRNGHSFDLSTFVSGELPGAADVALTQTLVNVASAN